MGGVMSRPCMVGAVIIKFGGFLTRLHICGNRTHATAGQEDIPGASFGRALSFD